MHANENVDKSLLRATLIVHFHDCFASSKIIQWNREYRKYIEKKNIEKNSNISGINVFIHFKPRLTTTLWSDDLRLLLEAWKPTFLVKLLPEITLSKSSSDDSSSLLNYSSSISEKSLEFFSLLIKLYLFY